MNDAAAAVVWAIEVYDAPRDALYDVDATAQLTGTERRAIVRYCRHGLVAPALDPETNGFYFDADAIRRLRRIEGLLPLCGDTLGSMRVILTLLDEVSRLQNRPVQGS